MPHKLIRIILAVVGIGLAGAAYAFSGQIIWALSAAVVLWVGALFFSLEQLDSRMPLLLALLCVMLFGGVGYADMSYADWMHTLCLVMGAWMTFWVCEALLGRLMPKAAKQRGHGMQASRLAMFCLLLAAILLRTAPIWLEIPEIAARVRLDEATLSAFSKASALVPMAYVLLMAMQPSLYFAFPATALFLASECLMEHYTGASLARPYIAFGVAVILLCSSVALARTRKNNASFLPLILPVAACVFVKWNVWSSFATQAWLFRLRSLGADVVKFLAAGAICGALLFFMAALSRMHWAISVVVFVALGVMLSVFLLDGVLPWGMDNTTLACAGGAYLGAWFATVIFGRGKSR